MKIVSNTKKVTVSKDNLRRIVTEEIKKLRESVDYDGVKVVVTESSKLLKVLNQFKENATQQMIGSTTPHIDTLIKTLEEMIHSPSSYVDKVKPVAKTVKLRKVDDDI